MAPHRTPREMARARTLDRIIDLGRRQLGEVGPSQLSLRAVARELGMSSSAVYRYVSSRDELLTHLIIESYNDLGATIELADDPRDHPTLRWRKVGTTLRQWSCDHPHQWALLFGTPVPGYCAPESTIEPAARTVDVLTTIVADNYSTDAAKLRARALVPPSGVDTNIVSTLSSQLSTVSAFLEVDLPPSVIVDLVGAWSQLVGTLTLELGGHYAGTMEPLDAYWDYLVARLGDQVLGHE